MGKKYYYTANNFAREESYLVAALNKRQMKASGYNMKLEWKRDYDYHGAKCNCSYEIVSDQDISNNKY